MNNDNMNINDLLKSAQCIYLACEQIVADDISAKLKWAANEIQNLYKNIPQWVDCSNELPKNRSRIINDEIYYKDMYVQQSKGNLCIAFYDEEQKQWFMPIGLPIDNVSRWCDCLPEPTQD